MFNCFIYYLSTSFSFFSLFFSFWWFQDRLSLCKSLACPRTHFAGQTSLKLTGISLILPPEIKDMCLHALCNFKKFILLTCEHTCTYMHAHECPPMIRHGGTSFSLPLCFETGYFTKFKILILAMLAVQWAGRISCLCSRRVFRHMHLCLSLSVGARCVNSNPHVFTSVEQMLLPTEPSSLQSMLKSIEPF